MSSTVRHDVVVDESPLLVGTPSDAQLTDQVLAPIRDGSTALTLLIALAAPGALLFGAAILYTIVTGIGVWGNDIPNAWALGIVNFVFWIGIGHAGTFISAILLLLEQPWRNAINRFAETMTLIAVAIAGMFPLLHLGRPWFFYWLIPYPATMEVWPQFRSTLPWDVAAILSYFTISLLFWYMGLVPDLAAARDRLPGRWRKRAYGVFALGWRSSARHWQTQRLAYGLLAGLATPLVVSVHTIVSLDFAIANLTGWHSTMFPPYFVIGAIHSGFAMVLVLVVPIRWGLRLRNVVTARHLASCASILLACACLMGYCYAFESFVAWYSGDTFERQTYLQQRPFGPYGATYWLTILAAIGVPQVLWVPRLRRSPLVVFLCGISVVAGMWLERFFLIVGPLSNDWLPSSWGPYTPTIVDGALLLGSFGTFAFFYLLFLRLLPAVPVSEVKETREDHGPRPFEAAMPALDVGDDAPGVIAEFTHKEHVIAALVAIRALGVRRVDAHLPWRDDEIIDAVGPRRAPVAAWTLAGALFGGVGAYVLQWWTSAIAYPVDVAGRPLHSALAFVPITFEIGVLTGGITAFAAWMGYCGLPRPWHPVFEIPGFERATNDRFFVTVDGRDPAARPAHLATLLRDHGALSTRPIALGDA